jgi:hypothetical protein
MNRSRLAPLVAVGAAVLLAAGAAAARPAGAEGSYGQRALTALVQRWQAIARYYDADGNRVVGAWHVTVDVTGSTTPFDTLYLFNPGGGFARIDGRNNAAAVGSWTENGNSTVSLTFVLFSFDPTGHRQGTITAQALGHVRGGILKGSFTASGTDMTGKPLPGYPKSGTYTGTRIDPQPS